MIRQRAENPARPVATRTPPRRDILAGAAAAMVGGLAPSLRWHDVVTDVVIVDGWVLARTDLDTGSMALSPAALTHHDR